MSTLHRNSGIQQAGEGQTVLQISTLIGARGNTDLLFIGINPRVSNTNRNLHNWLMASEIAFNKIAHNQLENGEPYVAVDGGRRTLPLAPLLVKTIFEKIVEINRERSITILLVEQNAKRALEISHFGYVLETGRIILQDDSAALRQNPQVKGAYLGG